MRRVFSACLAAVAAMALAALPAAAHTGWEPATAAPGSVIDLTLFVEDERPTAGTNKVELRFPEPITVVELPPVPGWTAALTGGEVGSPVTAVTWQGGPEPGDVRLPITLGPLPDEPGRLQFKAIQTYDNGDEDAWIADWPEGAPEPDNPGPVLDLVAGGPGSIPTTTATTAAPTTTTVASTTTETDQAAAADTDDDSDSSVAPIVVAAAVIVAGAGGAYAWLRSR
jgi:uncharacterized protein YcnI